MKKLFELCKGKLVRLSDTVVGIVCGYTDSYFIILLEEGTIAEYSFSLDELGKESYYIDASYEEECENCMYSYANEHHIFKSNKWITKNNS